VREKEIAIEIRKMKKTKIIHEIVSVLRAIATTYYVMERKLNTFSVKQKQKLLNLQMYIDFGFGHYPIVNVRIILLLNQF
jgi:hypothetical protein